MFCHLMLITNTCPQDAKIYLNTNVDIITLYTCLTRVILTSDPVVVSHQCKETRPAAHVPDTYALISTAAGQEWSRIGAATNKTNYYKLLQSLLLSPVLVISSSCITSSLIDGLGGGLWSPGDTLHHVVMIPHLYLDILP